MRKLLCTIIAVLVSTLFINAQNRSSLLERVNEIKTQTNVYYWNQYTHPDADTAKVNAVKRLLISVNIKRSDEESVSYDELFPHAKFICMNRGNLKDMFAYVEIAEADALGYHNGPKPVFVPVVPETDHSGVEDSYAAVPQTPPVFVPDAFVRRIIETKSFMSVYKLLKSLQSQGQVLQFGKLKDVEDYSSLDLILFDMQSQEVITMLSGEKPNGNRTNMISGTSDSLDNYPTTMTAVIWYIKK